MNSEEINTRLKNMAIGGREDSHNKTRFMCLTCNAAPNTIAELQDLIEDVGIPLDKIVASINTAYKTNVFYVARGRLRIKDYHSGGSCKHIDINVMRAYITPQSNNGLSTFP